MSSIKGQIDLWTRKQSGCACSWQQQQTKRNNSYITDIDKLENGCACCVKGGCQCGEESSTRCVQCGLEQHCNNSKS